MEIKKIHEDWADRVRMRPMWRKPEYLLKEEYRKRKFWIDLIEKQGGKCNLTGVKLRFDKESGIARKKSNHCLPGHMYDHLCHPLYASVDHIKPGCDEAGFQIICFDINDLKGHMPEPLMGALEKTPELKIFVKEWKNIAEKFPNDRRKFKKLIEEGKPLKINNG